ncbi:hypothetical protein [Lysinibacillus sp. NPDC093692]|uniref:hypothetical protein n=1 Tax=Lysinibacillus sp. NPDC093692 TaxID=3390578 RepID=UPI003CFD44C2
MLKERALTTRCFRFNDYRLPLDGNAIKEMRAEMIVGAKTAQYGIEATLPINNVFLFLF